MVSVRIARQNPPQDVQGFALADAVILSNVVGGFLITDRMLRMFKASGTKKS